MNRQSAIYRGRVRHRRFAPVEHDLEMDLFMMYVDLDELPGLFDRVPFWSTRRSAPARFERADFLGDPAVSLKEAVYRRVEEETGRRPDGPVRMLAHLRYFGHSFNPVTFYYVYSRKGRLETIVAEITNTPWKERHAYVLPVPEGRELEGHHFRFGKVFHVSPFMDMDFTYDWRFTRPGDDLTVHMENHRDGERTFDATMLLERQPITAGNLNRALLRYPFMTLRVVVEIYLHAARLWIKGVPFHSHPKKRTAKPEAVPAHLEESR